MTTRGFTLLELLVALSVFAVMSGMAYGGLVTMIDSRQHMEKEATKLREIQRAFSVIARDFRQVVERPVRDESGQEVAALVGAAELEGMVIEFTRNGWRNPTGAKRSNMQRVAYHFADSALVRKSWQVLDRAYDSSPFSTVLLRGVERFEVRYFNEYGQVTNVWPPESEVSTAGQATLLPRAVEIVVDLKGWGRINRIFVLAGG